MQDEYELIPDDDTGFLFSVYRLKDVLPHIHRELEIGLVLDGEMLFFTGNRPHCVRAGDFWIVNSCRSHSFRAPSGQDCLFAELQISFRFFERYFPKIRQLEFSVPVLNGEQPGEAACRELADMFRRMAAEYLAGGHHCELKTAAMVNLFFDRLLDLVPVSWLPEDRRRADYQKVARIRRLTDCVKEGNGKTLFLSEIAEKEGLSMSRLSHFFRESFGMSFQEYLLRVRAEKARAMLEEDGKASLLDVSISCGFSDPKYLNRGFKKVYGVSPKEYRKRIAGEKSVPEASARAKMNRTERILGEDACRLLRQACAGLPSIH